jgi:hypothetical protein
VATLTMLPDDGLVVVVLREVAAGLWYVRDGECGRLYGLRDEPGSRAVGDVLIVRRVPETDVVEVL